MKLIFELGVEGRGMTLMPECDVPEYQLPEERSEALHLPHVSENELTRHYTALCKRIHGVNDGAAGLHPAPPAPEHRDRAGRARGAAHAGR